ncbi:uncharacterized protein LOC135196552 [Macrobrachium nipponense]|uniref:uncharacterized protein LOC135196552 n=1 Tax=Macrobrachium nipponense TaxID=159736 RepID=UPI0030C8A881
MELAMDNSRLKIVTIEPFSSAVLERNKNAKLNSRNLNIQKNNKGKMKILPGNPKFIVLWLENNVLQNISIFKASREINNVCDYEPKILPQDDGTLFDEVSSPEQSEKLLKMNTLVGRKVVSLILFITKVEELYICSQIALIGDRRNSARIRGTECGKGGQNEKEGGGQILLLATLILTFNTHKLPNAIKARWLNFKVKPYIPSPLRCYHCQMFGHLIQKCRKKIKEELALCCNCGKEVHGQYNDPPSCINCGENHPASSKS